MNIKMMLDPDDPMRKSLEDLGIRDDMDSDYVIRRLGTNVRFLAGKKDDQQFFIDVADIIYIESMGHDILLHTKDVTYTSLWHIEYPGTLQISLKDGDGANVIGRVAFALDGACVNK